MKGPAKVANGLMAMKGGSGVARKLLACKFNVNDALRTNATLRSDEWKDMDEAVVAAAQPRLVGVADLMSRGLVRRITNGLGKTVTEYEDVSDMTDAEVSIDAVTKGQNDRVDYTLKAMPLPITFKEFQINIRALNASRERGESLDVTQSALAGIKVAQRTEAILFTGLSTYTYGGGTIYGYMDHPNRNTYSLTANWDDSAASGETILADVLAMIQASVDDRFYGPWGLYIPTNYQTALGEDFKSNSDKSVRQRLNEVEGLEFIKVADSLTADNVILVQLSVETVRMVEGLPITTVEWDTEGGMILHFKVMTINIPQLRADQNGRMGLVHGS